MTARGTAAVIGGGLFGAVAACRLASRGWAVALFEAEPELLARASATNQARIHMGYHYPRALRTALRCRLHYDRFAADFAGTVREDFVHLYAVARERSFIRAAQFETFCARIGAPLEPAGPEWRRLFDPERVEAVYRVREGVFDVRRLRSLLAGRLAAHGVRVRTATPVGTLEPTGRGVLLRTAGGETHRVDRALQCTYAAVNQFAAARGQPLVPLKHELTELCLVVPPPELAGAGLTVMDGPFFSLLPFPPAGLHTLSHVRLTPHATWYDRDPGDYRDPTTILRQVPRHTRFPAMIRDAAAYVPALREARYVDSLWEVKTVLPAAEADDRRPILVRREPGLPAVLTLLGAKLDNVYDALAEIDAAAPPGDRT